MKKMMILFRLIAFMLTGCGNDENTTSNAPKIEDYSWLMTTIQSTENEGKIIAYALDTVGVPDTSVEIVLKCSAVNDELTLSDETNGNSYTGTYKQKDTNVSYRNSIHRHINPHLGKVKLTKLNRGHIQQLYNKEIKVSESAVKLVKTVMNTALGYALEKKMIFRIFAGMI